MSHTAYYTPLTHLGDISIDEFFSQYWQKKPLLIRNAFINFESPISADELAGLALEEDVNSRLIIEHQPHKWIVEHGPIDENRFAELPENHWTLLVQHVDSLDPQVNALLNAFRFIPNWRLDDIMVSYAADKGGVGPHFDYFDVFLLQGEGKRRWRIGQRCDHHSALIPDQPMKLLTQFDTQHDWVVEPGDLLYIPAQTAHWGEAIGECITYSIGFRSPSHAELLLDYSQEAAAPLTEDNRYADPNLSTQKNCGEISMEVINTLSNILQNFAKDTDTIARWLGEFSTQLKHTTDFTGAPLNYITNEQFVTNKRIKLSPFIRSAFIKREIEGKQASNAYCFLNGTTYTCSLTLAEKICNQESIKYANIRDSDKELIHHLIAKKIFIHSE